MKAQRLVSLLFLFSGGIFLALGAVGPVRNTTWLIFGVVFLILGIATWRRSMPRSPD